MSWDSQEEIVCQRLKDYVVSLKPEEKKKLGDAYERTLSPHFGKWTTMNDLTFVILRQRQNVLDSISLALLKEMIGLGPLRYCVVRSYNQEFESLLMLALHYLPKGKFCMYPEEETLAGPFLHSPWSRLGKDICSRPTIPIEVYIAYLALAAKESVQD